MRKPFIGFVLMILLGSLVSSAAPGAASGQVAGAQAPNVVLSGLLVNIGGKFMITDEKTHVTVEVRGNGLKKFVQSNVRVEGAYAGSSAGGPQVLVASNVSKLSATAGSGTGAAAAGVKAGLSKAAWIGIGGGAAAAGGTVGALYATGTIGGKDEPASRP